MLKNRMILRKIRNIAILIMVIIIMIGAYKNIGDSRAEDVIEIEALALDNYGYLEKELFMLEAVQISDDFYEIELPESVNGKKINEIVKITLEEPTVEVESENANQENASTENTVTDETTETTPDTETETPVETPVEETITQPEVETSVDDTTTEPEVETPVEEATPETNVLEVIDNKIYLTQEQIDTKQLNIEVVYDIAILETDEEGNFNKDLLLEKTEEERQQIEITEETEMLYSKILKYEDEENGKLVEVKGYLPKDAELKVEELTEEQLKTIFGDAQIDVAYDIKIVLHVPKQVWVDETDPSKGMTEIIETIEVNPEEFGESCEVLIKDTEIKVDSYVYHVNEQDNSIEKVEVKDNTEENITFDAKSFSVYAVSTANIIEDVEENEGVTTAATLNTSYFSPSSLLQRLAAQSVEVTITAPTNGKITAVGWSTYTNQATMAEIVETSSYTISSLEGVTGIYYLHATMVLQNSTSTTYYAGPYYLDNTAPTVGTLTMKYNNASGSTYTNATWTNQDVYIAWTDGSDTAGSVNSGHESTVVAYTLNKPDGTIYNSGNLSGTSATLTAEGNYWIRITTTDSAGNSADKWYQVYIDKTAPTIAVSPTSGDWAQSHTVTVTLTDEAPGESAYGYQLVSGLSSGNTWIDFGWSTSNTTAPSNYTGISSTSYTMTTPDETGEYYLWVVSADVWHDNAGNPIEGMPKVVGGPYKVDVTAPIPGTLTMKLGDSSGDDYTNQTWTNQDVYIEVVDGYDVLADGVTETTDKSGHASTTYTVLKNLETYNGYADMTSGITLTEEGQYMILVKTTDKAGNTTTRTPPYYVKIDKTAPYVEFGLKSEYANYNNQFISVTFSSVYDDLSGVDYSKIGYRVLTSSGDEVLVADIDFSENEDLYPDDGVYCNIDISSLSEGWYRIQIYPYDEAGNWEYDADISFCYDKTAPTIEVTPDAADWAQSHEITVTIQDTLSGLAPMSIAYGYGWSTVAGVAPDSTTANGVGGWTTGYTGEVNSIIDDTPSQTGEYYLWITWDSYAIYDKAGNYVSYLANESGVYKIDLTKPLISAPIMKYEDSNGDTYSGGTWTNEDIYVKVPEATDAHSGMDEEDPYATKYTIKKDGVDYLTDISSNEETILTEEGGYYIYVTAKDKAGNEVTMTNPGWWVRIDKTAPRAEFGLKSEYANYENQFISVTFSSVYDDLSGIDYSKIGYRVLASSGTEVLIPDTDLDFSENEDLYPDDGVYCNIDISSLSEGRYRIQIYPYDEAGNWEYDERFIFCYDKTAPTATVTTVEKVPTNAADDGWAQSLTVTATMQDTLSGLAARTPAVRYGWSTSDTTQPTDTTYSYPTYTAGTTESVTLFTTTTPDTTGEYYLWVIWGGYFVDMADNHASTTQKFGPYKVDVTNPNIGSLTFTKEDGTPYTASTSIASYNWTNQNITVTVTDGTDAHSGHASTTYNINYPDGTSEQNKTTPVTLSAEGLHILQITTTDNVGNSVIQSPFLVSIDKTAPIPGTLTMKLGDSSGADYINDTWTNQSVYIEAVAGADTGTNQSGHASTTYSYIYTDADGNVSEVTGGTSETLTAEGTYAITVTTEDNAGNIAINTYTIKIDKTAPIPGTLTMKLGDSSGADYTNDTWTNQSVYIEAVDGYDVIELADGTTEETPDKSGHASTTYSYTFTALDGTVSEVTGVTTETLTAEGIYTITVTTKDNAGNTAINTYTVKIDKTAPIPGTLTMKLGDSSGSDYTNDAWTNQDVYIEVVNGYDVIELADGTTEETLDKSGHASTTYSYTYTDVNGTVSEVTGGTTETLTAEGTYAITVTTKDNAGNIAINTYTIKIDKTAPTLTVTPESADWAQSHTVNITVQDNLSGMNVAILQYGWSTSNTEEPTYTILNAHSFESGTTDPVTYDSITTPNATGEYYLWIYTPTITCDVAENDLFTIGDGNEVIKGIYKVDLTNPVWELQSITTNQDEQTVTVVVDGTDAHSGWNDISIDNLTVKVDGETASSILKPETTEEIEANKDKIFKEITSIEDITNANGTGKRYTITLSEFDQPTRQTGKDFLEWSGKVSIQMEPGASIDNAGNTSEVYSPTDTTHADFIRPELTYKYADTVISSGPTGDKSVTFIFDVTDKYYLENTFTVDDIIINITDTDPDTNISANITKTLTKVSDLTHTVNGTSQKVGEKYQLVITGLDKGDGYTYSGPMSVTIPDGKVTDTSSNSSLATTTTFQVGIDEPDGTGSEEIVDVVSPIWQATPTVAQEGDDTVVTITLKGIDKYFDRSELQPSDLQFELEDVGVITGLDVQFTSTTNLTDGIQYEVKIKGLNSAGYRESDADFYANRANGTRLYREMYPGTLTITIPEGKLFDQSGNTTSTAFEVDLAVGDLINPDIVKVSGTPNIATNVEESTYTVVFDIVDKHMGTSAITTTDTSKIHVYLDDTEITGLTKTITDITELRATVEGTDNKLVGYRYTMVLSNFKNTRTTATMGSYTDWSGSLHLKVDANAVTDTYNLSNNETIMAGDEIETQDLTKRDFVDYIRPDMTYVYSASDIDSTNNKFQMVFDLVDKYYDTTNSPTLTTSNLESYLEIKVDGVDVTTNSEITKELSSTDVTTTIKKTVSAGTVTEGTYTIGKRYTLTLSELDKGEGVDYSGIITVVVKDDVVYDQAITDAYGGANGNNGYTDSSLGNVSTTTTIKSGDDNPTPPAEGDGTIVDVVNPVILPFSDGFSINTSAKTATIQFDVIDKYLDTTITDDFVKGKITVKVDGEVASDITKTLTSTTITNGKRYTLVLSGFEGTTTKTATVTSDGSSATFKEWSGTVSIDIAEGAVQDTGKEGNGVEPNQNEAITITGGHIDFIKPVITKVSSTLNATETIVFNVMDKYLDTTDKITTDEITVYLDGAVPANVTKVISEPTNIEYDGQVVGHQYTLEISNLEGATTTTFTSNPADDGSTVTFTDGAGTLTIKIAAGAAKDYGNGDTLATATNPNGNQDTTLQGDFVDFVKPVIVKRDITNGVNTTNKTETIVFNVIDKYLKTSDAVVEATAGEETDEITVCVDGEETTLTGTLTMLRSYTYTTASGTTLTVGQQYQLVVSNLSGSTKATIEDSTVTFEDYSGTISLKIKEEAVQDTSGNKNEETTITGDHVDFILPVIQKVSSVKGSNKETITINIIDKYLNTSDSLTGSEITVYVDGEETALTGTLTKVRNYTYTTAAGTTLTVGQQYQLVISNFTGSSKTSNVADDGSTVSFSEYSGTIKIKIKEAAIKDYGSGTTLTAAKNETTTDNKNIETQIDGDFVDFIKPVIADITVVKDEANKKETITFNVIDKYLKTTDVLTTSDTAVTIDGVIVAEAELDGTLTKIREYTYTYTAEDGTETTLTVGHQYQLVLYFEQSRTAAYGTYTPYSGTVNVYVANGAASDTSNNTNAYTTLQEPEFIDWIAPDVTYVYAESSQAVPGDIDYGNNTFKMVFEITDKYFDENTSETVVLSDLEISIDGEDIISNEDITKTLSEPEDVTVTMNKTIEGVITEGTYVIGKRYTLTLENLEQGDAIDYSGVVSLTIPAEKAYDLGSTGDGTNPRSNSVTTITSGIPTPGGSGTGTIVDVVNPIWMAENMVVNRNGTGEIVVELDLIGFDKYFSSSTLQISDITYELGDSPATLTTTFADPDGETVYVKRDGNGGYVTTTQANAEAVGVKYSITISNFGTTGSGYKESDESFYANRNLYNTTNGASGRVYREFESNLKIKIPEGKLLDTSGNSDSETFEVSLEVGDAEGPEIIKVSGTKNIATNVEESTYTIVFDVVDKNMSTSNITTTDASAIHVYFDDFTTEATSITKTIKSKQELRASVNGNEQLVGYRYTLELSDFKETAIPNTGADYINWSGDLLIKIDPNTAKDTNNWYNVEKILAGNEEKTPDVNEADFVDYLKPVIEKVSATKGTNTETIVFKVTDKYLDTSDDITAGEIIVSVDGDDDANNDITKQITNITEIKNDADVVVGKQYTLVLSNFQSTTEHTSSAADDSSTVSFTEWSGAVSIEVNANAVKDTGPSGDGTNPNKNIATPIEVEHVDFVAPVIERVSSNKGTNTETIIFNVIDKYLNTSDAVVEAATGDEITVYVDGAETALTGTLTKLRDYTYTTVGGTTLTVGQQYQLVISNFTGSSQISTAAADGSTVSFSEYSGTISIKIKGGAVTDTSSNGNAQTSIDGDHVDFIAPVIEKKSSSKGANTETIIFNVIDKYLNTSDAVVEAATGDEITVYVDGEETALTGTLTKVRDYTYTTAAGTTLTVGQQYQLVISNFTGSNKTSIASNDGSTVSFSEYSGTISLKIKGGAVKDTSNNVNTETSIVGDHVDFIKPVIEKKSSAINTTAKTETIIFNVIDKYLNTSDAVSTSGIAVYVDGTLVTVDYTNSSATGLNGVLTKIRDYTFTTAGGTTLTVGQQYQLVLSNFEQTRTATYGTYTEYSGTVSIQIAASTVKDTSNNGNDLMTITGDLTDFVKPDITYVYSTGDINYGNKTFQMIFDVVDKYYDEANSIQLEDLTTANLATYVQILVDGEDITSNAEVTKTIIATDRTATINKTVSGNVTSGTYTIGKRYVLTLSNLEQLEIEDGENYADYSGVITVNIKNNTIKDTNGNQNDVTTTTMKSGVDTPGGTGSGTVVDVVDPIWSRDRTAVATPILGQATITLVGTDKYYASNKLVNYSTGSEYSLSEVTEIMEVKVDGVTTTSSAISIKIEQQTFAVSYGVKFKVTVTGFDINADKASLILKTGSLTDQSGNTNKECEFVILTCLMDVSDETGPDSAFLGNTTIQRQKVEKVKFTNVYSGTSSTTWDVSAAQDESILAWYEDADVNGAYEVYIYSDIAINTNVDSSYLFSYIGYSTSCQSTTVIENIGLLFTSRAQNMSHMFSNFGYRKLITLDLGSNFYTANVTNMSSMFENCGYTSMTSLILGDNFDTSKVTNMDSMFKNCGPKLSGIDLGNQFNTSLVTDMGSMFQGFGQTSLTSLDLGDNFYINNGITDMSNMFNGCGTTAMTVLDLGPAFTKIATNNTDFMTNCGTTGLIIYAPESIYLDRNSVK